MSTTTFASFSVTVAWDLAAFVGCLFAFNLLRKSPYTEKIYAPKRFISHPKYKRPKELPNTYFLGWIRPLLSYTEEEIIKVAGYDAAVYLRLFSFGIRLFTTLAVFNLLVVLPVNLTDDRVDVLERISSGDVSRQELREIQSNDATAVRDTQQQAVDFEDSENVNYEIGSFDKLSMTNIQPGSNRLWAHLLSIWVITLYTLKLLWEYHHQAVDLRIRFLATTDNGAEAHTVLVSDIPGLRFGSPLDRLMKSALFKYLPKRVREQVETSIEMLFTVASGGMSHMNNISTALAQNLADQLGGAKRPVLRRTRGQSSQMRSGSLNIDLHDPEIKWVNPEEVTDMKPVEWVTNRLADDKSLENIVFEQFAAVYPEGLVKCASLVYDTRSLEKLLKDYEKTTEQMEDLIDHYTTLISAGHFNLELETKKLVPLVEGKWAVEHYGAKPLEVEMLEFYSNKLRYKKLAILDELKALPQKQVPAAFVTFKTRWAQTVAATAFHHHFPTFWNVRAAPNPEEVVWENLMLRGWERLVRLIAAWGAFAVICVFFFVPVVFVQGLIQMDRLDDYPVIGPFVKFPIVNGILRAVLPNLALKLFLIILPAILRNMSRRQGLISLNEIDFEVVRKYFIFQTITVFFFSFVASSILNQIQEIIDNPDALRDILGVAAPQAATFFISYVLYTGLFEGGIQFLNLVNLLLLWSMGRFAGTERAKARIWKDQTISYGEEVPGHTLTILIGLAFSVINPIILPVVLLYFLAMKLMWTYNVLYIYSEEYQSGGKLWEHVFEHVIAGLVITQSIMIGLFAIKKFAYSALLIPLPFLTLLYRAVVHRLYDKPLQILSLRAAHDLDCMDQEEAKEEGEEDDGGKYKHPAFLIDWEELEKLTADAQKILNTLKGLKDGWKKTEYLPTSRA